MLYKSFEKDKYTPKKGARVLFGIYLFFLSQAFGTTSNCSYQAEQFVSSGFSQPGEFREFDSKGNLVYVVSVNSHGGDAAYEVVMEPESCRLVSKRLLWSE